LGGALTASKIASFLDILSDGKWHRLEEIQRNTSIVDKQQIMQIAEFLKEYNFIAADKTGERIRLKKIVQEFLTQATTA
jgi:hypothetical protein